MSVIITDAWAALCDSVDDISSEVTQVLHVDDMLIVDEHCELTQIYVVIITTQRKYYKLIINWSKLEYVSDVHHLSFNLMDRASHALRRWYVFISGQADIPITNPEARAPERARENIRMNASHSISKN